LNSTPYSILRSASISPLSFPTAPALAKTVPNQMNTPREALPCDPQTPSRGATTFESPHPPSADRGLARSRADGLGHKDPSVTSYRPPAILEYSPATTESPRRGHMDAFAAPHIAPMHPEYTPTSTEDPSRQDRKDSSAASHRQPVPITRCVPDVTQFQEAPTEGSITKRKDPCYRGHGYDLSASHLPDMDNSRKRFGQSLKHSATFGKKGNPHRTSSCIGIYS
jgi:hypothetical protein